jgi:tetratricopeptide (TPR) repeat protein
MLAVDLVDFFAAIFDSEVESKDLLKPAGQMRGPSEVWLRIEEATKGLEMREPGSEDSVLDEGLAHSLTVRQQVAKVKVFRRCRLQEQRRRLRSARKYRDRTFVLAYLQHLEETLDTRPHAVRQLTETLAVDLVPFLEGGGNKLLLMQCRILGLYGAAEMILGAKDDASRALSKALDLVQERGFVACQAELFERGARLLWARCQPQRALHLLDRAQLLHFDLGQRAQLGRVLADRGAILSWQREDRAALRVLTQSLSYLGAERGDGGRYRALALKRLARVYERLGDSESARTWRQRARRAQFGKGEEWLETLWDCPPGAVRGPRWR